MKIIRFFLQLAFAIALVFVSVWFYPTSVQPQTTLISQELSEPPSTPPPSKTEPGGGLNPNSSCSEKAKRQLTALVPKVSPSLTTSAYPTFLFYVPYESQNISVGEFSVLAWPDEITRKYKTSFTLPMKPGIVSISLPSSLEYALKEDKTYHWYFTLYGNKNTSSKPDCDVNGFVQRVTLTSERERQISTSTADIWYDSLAKLAERLRVSPQDPTLRNKWTDLLNSINHKDLAQEELVGAVIIKD